MYGADEGERLNERWEECTATDIRDIANNKWRHAMFMSRWASRLTLQITEVRVQRLKEISASDAIAEGIEAIPHTDSGYLNYTHKGAGTGYYTDREGHPGGGAIGSYETLWNSIHGADSWHGNPWVWALTFKVHKHNIDRFLLATAS